MELTEKYKEALKECIKNNSYRGSVYFGTKACCGVAELSVLPYDPPGIAGTIDKALRGYSYNKGLNMIIYTAPTGGFKTQLAILKEFGFQSIGTFRNPNTGLILETVYFING
jgi:hypothetical protein